MCVDYQIQFFCVADVNVIGNEMEFYGYISKLFLNQEHPLVTLGL